MVLNGSRNGAHVQSFQFHKKEKKKKNEKQIYFNHIEKDKRYREALNRR